MMLFAAVITLPSCSKKSMALKAGFKGTKMMIDKVKSDKPAEASASDSKTGGEKAP